MQNHIAASKFKYSPKQKARYVMVLVPMVLSHRRHIDMTTSEPPLDSNHPKEPLILEVSYPDIKHPQSKLMATHRNPLLPVLWSAYTPQTSLMQQLPIHECLSPHSQTLVVCIFAEISWNPSMSGSGQKAGSTAASENDSQESKPSGRFQESFSTNCTTKQ